MYAPPHDGALKSKNNTTPPPQNRPTPTTADDRPPDTVTPAMIVNI